PLLTTSRSSLRYLFNLSFLSLPRAPSAPLFPYTTLFRSGRGVSRETAQQHLDAGAKQVIISAPAKGDDVAIVLGDDDLLHTRVEDRKSTRLNSSHGSISYAVFFLKKKNKHDNTHSQYLLT